MHVFLDLALYIELQLAGARAKIFIYSALPRNKMYFFNNISVLNFIKDSQSEVQFVTFEALNALSQTWARPCASGGRQLSWIAESQQVHAWHIRN